MAEFNLEQIIKSGVEKALNKPIVNGKSITEWAAIGMKAPRWISVKDRLPEDETVVIAYVQHKIGWYRMFAWHDMYGWHSSAPEFDDKESDYVTHWMPLPEPPEEGKRE
jgi:hypothetical protein